MSRVRFWNAPRPISAPSKRHVAERIARQMFVTVDHLLDVVAKRKRFREARYGMSALRLHKRITTKWLMAGEGRFHELLKIAGMTEADFAERTGLSESTVRAWYGFPMHGWAVELLELVVWKQNAEKKLRSQGYDPAIFNAGHLPESKQGRVPKSTEAGKRLLASIEGI